MFKISRKRKRQWIGFGVGLLITSITYTYLSIPAGAESLSLGPMNTGHENLSCESCHTPASGNVFQQIQANVMFSLGMRKTVADFGTENVDTKKCLECHDRDNDRHPLHRFKEPRFSAARKSIGHEGQVECESCHKEHQGVRVTMVDIGYCRNCHEDTRMNNDPLEISHEELIAREMWNTCLQCHDFHGNHIFHAAESMNDTIPVATVREYFDGGKTPYSDVKKYLPLTEEEWAKGMRGAK